MNSHLESVNDPQKLNSLYAAFRSRDANPVGYDYKMQFWKNAVMEEGKQRGLACLNLTSLQQRFMRDGKIPLGLKVVLEQMWREGLLQTKLDYDYTHSGWVRWGFHTFVQRPVRWSLSWLTNIGKIDVESTEFILCSALKDKADLIKTRHYDYVRYEMVDDVVELKEFLNQSSDIVSGEGELLQLLNELERRGDAVTRDITGIGKIVKFAHRDSTSGRLEITDVDIGILKLRRAIASLETQTAKTNDDISSLTNEVKKLLREQKKNMAKSVLRRRKKLESVLDHKMQALENLTNLLHRLEESGSDAMVYESYRLGVESLKQANANMSIDKLNNTFDEIQETMEEQNEMSSIMSSPIVADTPSQVELEEELDDLLEQTSSKKSQDVKTPVVGFNTMPSISDMDLLNELHKLEVPSDTPGQATSTPVTRRTKAH